MRHIFCKTYAAVVVTGKEGCGLWPCAHTPTWDMSYNPRLVSHAPPPPGTCQ